VLVGLIALFAAVAGPYDAAGLGLYGEPSAFTGKPFLKRNVAPLGVLNEPLARLPVLGSIAYP
jgi:hypothetical protein